MWTISIFIVVVIIVAVVPNIIAIVIVIVGVAYRLLEIAHTLQDFLDYCSLSKLPLPY